MLGYAFCGSFCTHKSSLEQLEKLVASGYDVQPIFSFSVFESDTRFGSAADLKERVERICGRSVIHTVKDAEPLGPRMPLEALVICPCTGNTLAKLASGITDTPVLMAAKAHLRGDRPLVIALASNDALSANLANIGTLLMRKCVYFVPMIQDDPTGKPHSLVADFSRLSETLEGALMGKQLRKLFL